MYSCQTYYVLESSSFIHVGQETTGFGADLQERFNEMRMYLLSL